MPQHHTEPDPSNIQPVALCRVRVEELDEAGFVAVLDGFPYSVPDEDRSAEVERELWDERNDGDRFE